MQCSDGSDEENCPIVLLPNTYMKLSPPKEVEKELPVFVNVSAKIISVPSVLTVDMRFTVNYILYCKWFDHRLTMVDLHDDLTSNELPNDKKGQIWHPAFRFRNSISLEGMTLDQETAIYAEKNKNVSSPVTGLIDGAESK